MLGINGKELSFSDMLDMCLPEKKFSKNNWFKARYVGTTKYGDSVCIKFDTIDMKKESHVVSMHMEFNGKKGSYKFKNLYDRFMKMKVNDYVAVYYGDFVSGSNGVGINEVIFEDDFNKNMTKINECFKNESYWRIKVNM